MAKTIRFITWAATGIFALAFMTQPVSADAQLALAGTIIVAMIAIWRFGSGLLSRWVFLALGSIVVARYMYWRATSTLPPIDQPLNFSLGLLLVAAELYCVLILIISLIINAAPLDRKPLEREDDETLPTVDVFIPSYNEDESILATTIAAAKSMDYPREKLTVWLLDDGGTDQKVKDRDATKAASALARRHALQALCVELGARYLTRAKNEHAKAGNMNNGLLHATGEVVVVFDADHAPFRSFLRETVGYFAKDPKLFLVQTPHVFLNPDPIERNLRTFEAMPSENEMFYSVTQRGLDKWNSSFFCGSAALLRRAALDVAGGFSGITITEDCETAFELHAKGWNSVYVDKPLIAGLQPETFDSFIGQRSRWCQGMFQILLLKNPLFKKGLKPIQKLAYLSSMTFWFFPLPRMVFTFAPLLHIFLDVKIFVSSMDEALAYTATYMVVNLLLQNYLYGRVRWPFMSELYEYVQGVYLAKAIISVLLRPRKPTFNVTAKGTSLDRDQLSGLARPFFVIFAILFVGAATAFYRYWMEPGAELMLIVGLWTTFNLVIAGAALGVVAERKVSDRFPRLTIDRRALLTFGEAAAEVIVTSVSAGGCSLRFADADAAPARFETAVRSTLTVVPLEGRAASTPLVIGLVHQTLHEDGTTFGFSFGKQSAAGHMALADLMYGDPDAMLRFIAKRRRHHKSILAGSLQFLRWGLIEPMRATAYSLRRRSTEVVASGIVPIEVVAPVAASEVVTPRVVAQAIVPEVLAAEVVAAVPAVTTDVSAPIVEKSTPVISIAAFLDTTMDVEPAASVDVASLVDLTTANTEFDTLMTDLVDKASEDEEIDVTAGWLSALLTLAADEMRRTSAAENETNGSAYVAA